LLLFSQPPSTSMAATSVCRGKNAKQPPRVNYYYDDDIILSDDIVDVDPAKNCRRQYMKSYVDREHQQYILYYKNKNSFEVETKEEPLQPPPIVIPLLSISDVHTVDKTSGLYIRSPKKIFIVTSRFSSSSPPLSPMTTKVVAPAGKVRFNDANLHCRNIHVQRSDNHVYGIFNDFNNTMSITQFIDTIVFPSTFNPVAISGSIVSSEKYKQNQSPYSNMTQDEIQAAWKEKGKRASEHGTRVHDAIYTYFELEQFGMDTSAIPGLPNGFRNFRRCYPEFKPFLTEQMVYSHDHFLAGTFDALFEEGILIDWKTNQEALTPLTLADSTPHPASTNSLHPSVRHMANTPYYRDVFQLNLYAHFLTTYYDIPITKMFIVQFKNHDLTSFEFDMIPVPVVDVQPALATRQEQLRQLYHY